MHRQRIWSAYCAPKGLSLRTLEEHTPLGEMDLIGFSLQYEMTYTQVLNMLDLGGIPLYTRGALKAPIP